MAWNPAQYDLFRDERYAPFSDLVALGRFRPGLRIVDLGCGTGSNLRASAPRLGPRQHWTLVDYDVQLIVAARTRLSAWADGSEPLATGGIRLLKAGRVIDVEFRQADLARDLEGALGSEVDLVTASALFDLCSVGFIADFAAAVAARRATFYTVLTYNGVQRWTPAHAADAAMAEAFHTHQNTDKGFGRSSGPEAPMRLAETFRACGYRIEERDTPWVLEGAKDARLVGELQSGFAGAVRETGRVAPETIAAWQSMRRTGAVVGHTDTLALPPR